MIVAVQLQAGTSQQLRKGADPGGLLAINDDQTGNPGEVQIFGTDKGRNQIGMTGTELPQVFSWEPGKQSRASGYSRPAAVSEPRQSKSALTWLMIRSKGLPSGQFTLPTPGIFHNLPQVIILRLPAGQLTNFSAWAIRQAGSPGRRSASTTVKSTPLTCLTMASTSRTLLPRP